jgi:hypothetical protein
MVPRKMLRAPLVSHSYCRCTSRCFATRPSSNYGRFTRFPYGRQCTGRTFHRPGLRRLLVGSRKYPRVRHHHTVAQGSKREQLHCCGNSCMWCRAGHGRFAECRHHLHISVHRPERQRTAIDHLQRHQDCDPGSDWRRPPPRLEPWGIPHHHRHQYLRERSTHAQRRQHHGGVYLRLDRQLGSIGARARFRHHHHHRRHIR